MNQCDRNCSAIWIAICSANKVTRKNADRNFTINVRCCLD